MPKWHFSGPTTVNSCWICANSRIESIIFNPSCLVWSLVGRSIIIIELTDNGIQLETWQRENLTAEVFVLEDRERALNRASVEALNCLEPGFLLNIQ